METSSSKKIQKHLYIFNLSTDEKNNILSFTQDWVLAFKEIVTNVSVISTWVGSHSLPSDIKVIQIGGGNFIRRGTALIRLAKVGIVIARNRHEAIVFHHMSSRTAALLGPLFRISGIKQGLWYSHSKVTHELLFAERYMNKLFSSTIESLPIGSKKSKFTGHGINIAQFPKFQPHSRSLAILSLGRIAKIKENEALIDAISKSNRVIKEVHLVGPMGSSSKYLKELIDYGTKKGVSVKYLGEISHKNVAELLLKYSVCYTGNPNTVDKSVIEGALSGCFTLARQEFVLKQTGMSVVLEKVGLQFEKDLTEQILVLDEIYENEELRLVLRDQASRKNSLQNTASMIVNELLTP
jgi:glycosyltransferase involved in cell wall biosynthesis